MISLDSIPLVFFEQSAAFQGVRRAAKEAEEVIEAISPIIESHTAIVCPDCTSVCCINRHSRFDYSDIIFMAALSREVPEEEPEIAETDPCRFLSRRGCLRKRSERPYRCTWFFCSQLLDNLEKEMTISEHRGFIEKLEIITALRTKMIKEFETVFMSLSSLPGNEIKNK